MGDENTATKTSRWGLERKISTKEGGLLHSLFHPSRSQSNASSVLPTPAEEDPNGNNYNDAKAIPPPAISVVSASTNHQQQAIPGSPAMTNSRPTSPVSSTGGSGNNTNTHTNQPRFQLLEDGSHRHYLVMPTVSKLTSSLNGLTGLFHTSKTPHFKLPQWGAKEEDTLHVVDEKKLSKTTSDVSLAAKWGTCQEIIGKGAFGVVRIAHKVDPSVPGTGERLYAVKEFKKRSDETPKQYIKRLTSEFCISSTLHHRNIIQTLDLLPTAEASTTYCQVMDYCTGGDLFHLIFESSGGLATAEANCFFKQLIRGVEYLHRMGVSHRDLKPENLLLTTDGCLKISDFGSSECFRMAWDSRNNQKNCAIQGSTGICGSEPYIAPEQFEKGEFDPRLVDIWSCAVIYMAMRTGKHLWHVARPEDQHYERYLNFRQIVDEERDKARRMRSVHRTCSTDAERQAEHERSEKEKNEGIVKAREIIRRKTKEGGFDVLEGLEFGAKKLIYRMLDPKASRRSFASDILKNEWFASIWCCQPFEEPHSATLKSPCAADQTSISSGQSAETSSPVG